MFTLHCSHPSIHTPLFRLPCSHPPFTPLCSHLSVQIYLFTHPVHTLRSHPSVHTSIYTPSFKPLCSHTLFTPLRSHPSVQTYLFTPICSHPSVHTPLFTPPVHTPPFTARLAAGDDREEPSGGRARPGDQVRSGRQQETPVHPHPETQWIVGIHHPGEQSTIVVLFLDV